MNKFRKDFIEIDGKYKIIITRQSIRPISQFNSPCNESMRVWSMCVYSI